MKNVVANRARGWKKRGAMNRTEAGYAEMLERDPSVSWWKYEGLKLRIGDGAFYTPDFIVMKTDLTLEIHEVKGFWQEAAKVRIKVASDLYPFKFKAIKRQKGQWVVEEFS